MNKLISKKQQEEFIKSRGWFTWYNESYWVHHKTVNDPKVQDYTDYGMDLNSAYCFEKLNLPSFRFLLTPRMSQIEQGINNKGKIQKLLVKLEK